MSVRQYFAPYVVGARKLKAVISYARNPLLYEKRHCVFEPLFWGLGAMYAVHHLKTRSGLPIIVIIQLFSLGVTADEL